MSNRYWLLQVPETLSPDAGWAWRDTAASVGSAPAELDTSDQASAARGSLADFAAALAGLKLPVIALLPVAQVLAVPVNVPQRQQRQMLAALPFLLEETLASEIERFHVIAGARIDAQRLQVVAIERDWLRRALAVLQESGVDPDIVTADALALAAPGTVFLDGAHSLLLSHDGSALSFDAQDAALVLAALPVDERTKSVQLLVADAAADAQARLLAAEFSAEDVAPFSVQIVEPPRTLLETIAGLSGAAIARLPNLRQGAFIKTGTAEFSLGFDWRPLAWLAACWAVVAIGYQVAAGISYARAAATVKAAQVELYQQVFPGSNNVPRPRQQMEGQLASGAGQDNLFVSLVARTSTAFVELGGTASGYTPRSLAWDSAQKQLRIDVQARSLEDLEKLRALLEQKGLLVDIGAGIAQDGGYKARMNVGEGA